MPKLGLDDVQWPACAASRDRCQLSGNGGIKHMPRRIPQHEDVHEILKARDVATTHVHFWHVVATHGHTSSDPLYAEISARHPQIVQQHLETSAIKSIEESGPSAPGQCRLKRKVDPVRDRICDCV